MSELRELDVEVARVLGYRPKQIESQYPNWNPWILNNPDGGYQGYFDSEEGAWGNVPEFSTDPAAADLVRVWLEGQGYSINLHSYLENPGPKRIYQARIYTFEPEWEEYTVYNDLSPHDSLCRAVVALGKASGGDGGK